MLTKDDVRGVSVMVQTPCKEGAEGWDIADSVDLEETARMTEAYIRDGIGNFAVCGTTGECAALLWEEKLTFIDTMLQVTRKRVPIFAGATSLGTKETIRQMRAFKDIGADGAFVGLPLWQTPTIENAVQFFADLSQAVPDLPIMIYSNSMFFKSLFPTPFWAGVAQKAPTVICTKLTYPYFALLDDLRVAGHQINFMPGEASTMPVYKMLRPGGVKAVWSSGSVGMGPEPYVALTDAIMKDDEKRVDEIWKDIHSVPGHVPPGQFVNFPLYNAQVNRWAANAAGYINAGPSRAPYRLDDLPDAWKRQAEASAKGWTELRKKYAKVAAG